MGLDIRWPIGLMFTLIGAMLVLYGLFTGGDTELYQRSLAKGIKPTMVRLTLARKIAAITLTLWKKGENFDAEKLKSQAA
jgi:hypothetical protein